MQDAKTDLKQQGYNEWLVIRCQQGDEEAFRHLVDNWHQRFYLYACNRLTDKDDAQDATQECLLSISRSLAKLQDPAAFPKWSFRILERRCVDKLRKKIRERDLFQQETENGLPEIASYDAVESHLTVSQLLKTLDPRLASIVRLYYLEAFSIDEIAQVSELPAGTVKSRLFYARKMLAKALDKD